VRPALLVGISLQAFQQFVGINTVMYYSATILFMAGFEERTWAILLSDLVALSNAIFTIVSILLIDRVGRRPLLLSTLVGVVLGLALLGAAFFVKAGNTGYLALGALIVYVAFFAVGMGPIPWAVNSEIYPLRIRAVANSVATTVNWISNLVVSMTFLTVSEGFTVAGTFWTYGVVAIIAWIFFFFKLPETKGKTMEQIQFEMTGKSDGQIVAEESQDTTQSFGVELDEVEKV
jgi:MFS family permease